MNIERLGQDASTRTNLSNVDLDLFVVFRILFEERSATRAAGRLHVTRPAVSNALHRLRGLLGDELFIRTSRGLTPTPRAVEIASRVTQALDDLYDVVEQRERFDATASRRRFTLACSDCELVTVLPDVLEAFSRELPNATLRTVPLDQMIATNGLVTGEVDALLGTPDVSGSVLRHELLYRDSFAVLARRAHPRIRGKLTAKQFWAQRHVEISLFGDRPSYGARVAGAAETAEGERRRIAVTVPTFFAAAVAAARTDHLAVVPRRFASRASEVLPLQVLPLPFPLPEIPTFLVWHSRAEVDPGALSFRNLVARAAREHAAHTLRARSRSGRRRTA